MRLTKELAREITKTALIALINLTPERRRKYGLPRGVGTETIREVLQCMPDTDIEYYKARDLITRAARAIRKHK